jgi:hypothetical protein
MRCASDKNHFHTGGEKRDGCTIFYAFEVEKAIDLGVWSQEIQR